jgi:hypothetical protein
MSACDESRLALSLIVTLVAQNPTPRDQRHKTENCLER